MVLEFNQLTYSLPQDSGRGKSHRNGFIHSARIKCPYVSAPVAVPALKEVVISGKIERLNGELANIPCKGKTVNVFGFVSYIVCFANAQLCCCSKETATDNTQSNRYGYVPV